MSRRKRDQAKLIEREIRELLPDVLRLLDLGMPTTPEEVARAEAELEKMGVHLPDSLKDPFAVADRRPKRDPHVLSYPPTQEVVEELRQAARFGSDIPEEVRSRMNEDRVLSEREVENQGEND